jgi:hypothetical protein
MMTPLTTVIPFTFFICDLSGSVLLKLPERFVKCTEDEIPIFEELFETEEILLEANTVCVYNRFPQLQTKKLNGYNVYYTHSIVWEARGWYGVLGATPTAAWSPGSAVPGG